MPTTTPEINSMPVVYGKIYAEWCGACQALEPDWIQVQAQLKDGNEFSVEEKEMDIKRGEFTKQYKTALPPVDGYPTIYKLKKYGGMVETYNDQRTVQKMVDWIKN